MGIQRKSSRGVSYFVARLATRGVMVAMASWLTLSSASVEAQDRAVLQEEPDDEQRLRRWLQVRADRSGRRWAAGLAVGNAGLSLGAATALRLASDAPEAQWASIALVGIGFLSLTQGIVMFIAPDRAADDLRTLPERPLTEREIGRYEGLLELDARRARDRRRRSVFGGLGLALASAAGIPLLATSDVGSERGRGVGHGLLGGLLITGLVYLVSGLFESAEEADWREYRRGLAPAPSARGVRPHGLGVAF